jgi:hypothetical protein
MCVAVVTLLPLELANALEKHCEERGISKSALLRYLLTEYLSARTLEPQPFHSGPVGPGGSALRGAGFAGPETGGDVPQPSFIKEKAGGGEGG